MRTIGDGELRLDGYIETSDEIYTLLAVVHLKDTEIYRRIDVLINEMIEEEEEEITEDHKKEELGEINQSSTAHLSA